MLNWRVGQMAELSTKDAYSMMLTEYPDILTFEQMCEVLNVSPKTGYKLINARKIACIKAGRAYRIPKTHILAYLMIG